jgi:hypothetical protein
MSGYCQLDNWQDLRWSRHHSRFSGVQKKNPENRIQKKTKSEDTSKRQPSAKRTATSHEKNL